MNIYFERQRRLEKSFSWKITPLLTVGLLSILVISNLYIFPTKFGTNENQIALTLSLLVFIITWSFCYLIIADMYCPVEPDSIHSFLRVMNSNPAGDEGINYIRSVIDAGVVLRWKHMSRAHELVEKEVRSFAKTEAALATRKKDEQLTALLDTDDVLKVKNTRIKK